MAKRSDHARPCKSGRHTIPAGKVRCLRCKAEKEAEQRATRVRVGPGVPRLCRAKLHTIPAEDTFCRACKNKRYRDQRAANPHRAPGPGVARPCRAGLHTIGPDQVRCERCRRKYRPPKVRVRRARAEWLDWVVVMRIIDGTDPGRRATRAERACVVTTLHAAGLGAGAISNWTEKHRWIGVSNEDAKRFLREQHPTLEQAMFGTTTVSTSGSGTSGDSSSSLVLSTT